MDLASLMNRNPKRKAAPARKAATVKKPFLKRPAGVMKKPAACAQPAAPSSADNALSLSGNILGPPSQRVFMNPKVFGNMQFFFPWQIFDLRTSELGSYPMPETTEQLSFVAEFSSGAPQTTTWYTCAFITWGCGHSPYFSVLLLSSVRSMWKTNFVRHDSWLHYCTCMHVSL